MPADGSDRAQVFDQRLEHGDDPMGLIARLVSEVDVLVVERRNAESADAPRRVMPINPVRSLPRSSIR